MSAAVADDLRGPDLGRPVTHVLVCRNGHIGVRRAGNHLDICHECGEACELKPTSVSGKTRRRHSTARFTSREEVERIGPKVAPVPLPKGFALEDHQLERLRDGEIPTIAFPRDEMPPLRVGGLYRIGPELNIHVVEIRDTVTHQVAIYNTHRVVQQVREDEPEFLRGATHAPAWFNPITEQVEPAQPEAEPVGKAEVSRMAKGVREGRIAKLRESLEECKSALRSLEERTNKNANLCWGVRTTVERLEREITAAENADRPLAKAA